MCLNTSSVKTLGNFNWESGSIIHNPVIPRAREIPGTKRTYEVDIRELLSTQDNAVVRNTLNKIIDSLPQAKQSLFRSHQSDSFDYRVEVICKYLMENIRYVLKNGRTFDAWFFPDETIAAQGGDCEDRAILLMALLLASGISGYCLRIALGKIKNSDGSFHDHAWVMYKNESGNWMLLETLLMLPKKKSLQFANKWRSKSLSHSFKGHDLSLQQYEYFPDFLFNDSHLWLAQGTDESKSLEDYLNSRKFWEHFNPEFATAVHNQVIDQALGGLLSTSDLEQVRAYSFSADANFLSYDPRDHFDNSYIDDGWDLVDQRIKKGTISAFAYACHGVQDFYAHSSYTHFAALTGSSIKIYQRGTTNLPPMNYDGSAGFDFSRFTRNLNLYKKSSGEATTDWKNQIISGRYAQPGDPSQGILERIFVNIPSDLKKRPDFGKRGGVPHHNEIACDSATTGNDPPTGHILYQTGTAYNVQFAQRVQLAIEHTKAIYHLWLPHKV